MQDISYNDRPKKHEIAERVTGEAFAGELEPMNVALLPLRNLGKVQASVSALIGPGGTIPATVIDLGYVSYRLSRVTPEGTVYTIAPRLIMSGGQVEMPEGLTRRFWMTVKVPARPGLACTRGRCRFGPGKARPLASRSIFALARDAAACGYPRRSVWIHDIDTLVWRRRPGSVVQSADDEEKFSENA